ncbi:hypothetical protein [Haloplanus aerogenes]|uniref:Uncharacterized protein n=1 Tax=Haloplanus aerogenes TaxID=660522 RepID=A0A3M0DY60_9EURY|nr:hypothetical protein [Haloplanus aerogenes]AZH24218.1 hypothetical protein DU502_01990 [Haloplanus aerogenes]RMB24156.1 hypothetical protein ATH50_1396 [Haloplanus aerogenes]
MQRRAAAIYVAFFIVLGAASYSVIATATAPTVGFENPDHRLSEGDQFSVENRQYTVSAISAEVSSGGGGHGGGATVTRSGQLTWTNDSARYTQTWDHNSTVTYQDETYRVMVGEGDDPSSFRLVEEINRTAILQDDPAVNDETVTLNGTEYVVRESNGSRTLTPASEYFPTPASTQYQEGESLQFQGNTTTVADVTTDGATLAWTAPKTNTVDVGNEANVTVNGQQYFAYFPDNSTLVLESDYGVYQEQTEEIDTYHDHVNGLWGVSIVSFATAIMLLGMAYMPSRY